MRTTLRGLPLWLHGLAGYALIAIATTALVFGLWVMSQYQASVRAQQIAAHTWTKVRTTPDPWGHAAQIVYLRANDPSVSVRDQQIAIEYDDPMSQDILAIPDGNPVSFQLVNSKAYGSRTLAYNYLQPRLTSDPAQNSSTQQ